MNEFKVCDICEAVNSESIIKRLKQIDPKADIIVGCQGFCAVGATRPFVIVNGIPAIADTEDEVLKMVEKMLDV